MPVAAASAPFQAAVQRVRGLRTFARNMDYAVILNPASQAELRAGADFLYADNPDLAPQIEKVTPLVQVVRRHCQIAREPLAGLNQRVDDTVEAIPADISGMRTERVCGASAREQHAPVEPYPNTSAPVGSGIRHGFVQPQPVFSRPTCCTGVHDSEYKRSLHFPCQTGNRTCGSDMPTFYDHYRNNRP